MGARIFQHRRDPSSTTEHQTLTFLLLQNPLKPQGFNNTKIPASDQPTSFSSPFSHLQILPPFKRSQKHTILLPRNQILTPTTAHREHSPSELLLMGKNKATTHLGKKKEIKETQMPECDTHRVWRSRTNGNEENEEEEEEEAGI